MNRREMMGAMGLGAAALTVTGAARAEDKDKEGMDDHLKIMGECAIMCNKVAHHCLEEMRKKEGDVEKHAKVHELAIGCQEFCVLSATLMVRWNPLAKYAHEATAKACTDTADACEQHKDSELVKKCAESARKCAEACRQEAQHAHHHG